MNLGMKERFVLIREKSGLNVKQFASSLDMEATTVSSIESGKREPSKETLRNLAIKYNVNLNWVFTGEGEVFITSPKEEKHPLVANLEAMIDQRLEKIEAQIAELKGQLKKKGGDGPDSGMLVSEPEPEYGADVVYKKISFVDDIAAGPPIPQSEDLSGYIDVPEQFIKTEPGDYYAARIRGESMTAAGIPDGCTVLIRRSDVPRDGAIQVVRSGGKSTLKRMREGEDHTWTLRFEDNSGWFIPIGPGEEFQVQGDFVAVLSEAE